MLTANTVTLIIYTQAIERFFTLFGSAGKA